MSVSKALIETLEAMKGTLEFPTLGKLILRISRNGGLVCTEDEKRDLASLWRQVAKRLGYGEDTGNAKLKPYQDYWRRFVEDVERAIFSAPVPYR